MRVQTPSGARCFSLLHPDRPWTHLVWYWKGTGVQSSAQSRQSPPPNAERKNEWSYTSAPLICLHGLDGLSLFFTLLRTKSVHVWMRRQINKSLGAGMQFGGFKGLVLPESSRTTPLFDASSTLRSVSGDKHWRMNTSEVRIPSWSRMANEARKYNLFNYNLYLTEDKLPWQQQGNTIRYITIRRDTTGCVTRT
jgi:hypothetical protein